MQLQATIIRFHVEPEQKSPQYKNITIWSLTYQSYTYILYRYFYPSTPQLHHSIYILSIHMHISCPYSYVQPTIHSSINSAEKKVHYIFSPQHVWECSWFQTHMHNFKYSNPLFQGGQGSPSNSNWCQNWVCLPQALFWHPSDPWPRQHHKDPLIV